MNRWGIVCLNVLVLSGLACAAGAQTIDHGDVGGVTLYAQETLDDIGQQVWLFTHASVGGNMMNGMTALNTSDATRYQLVRSTVGFDGTDVDAPPATTVAGTVYDCQRGNPGWSSKFAIFDDAIRNEGWDDPAKVGLVMDKLCYIDQAANATTYTTMMNQLETDYPDLVFVYTTMPLTTGEDASNILRNNYNDVVRQYCSANGKLLFDIADIEAHDPSNVEQTFESGGSTYQKLYSGYTSDGGHLNTAGAERVALGWYATAATQTAPATSAPVGTLAGLAASIAALAGAACWRLRRRG